MALREYPKYAASGDERADAAMLRAGFAPGSEFLWDFNYRILWDGTQRRNREEVDPGFDGDLDAGTPYCRSGTPNCDADHDYDTRPKSAGRPATAGSRAVPPSPAPPPVTWSTPAPSADQLARPVPDEPPHDEGGR
ncbi:hypothetical protein [Nonomuraea jabiensis]|uniref:hypothetical protein n=1 Tax=Nonomuraea jabiensis TaxID=882448 RepID=UPI0036B589AA